MDSQRKDKREEQTEKKTCNFGIRRHRRNSHSKSSEVQRECNPEEQVRVTSPIVTEAHSPVPAEEEERGTKYVPWNFGHDLTCNHCSPAVHLTEAFTDLVDVAHVKEGNLELIRQRNGENSTHVNGLKRIGQEYVSQQGCTRTHEKLVLSALQAVL